MKAEFLYERAAQVPMLRAVVPFAAGIWAAMYADLPLTLTAAGVVVCGAVALATRSSLYTAAMLFAFGFTASQLQGARSDLPLMLRTDFDLLLVTPPAPRDGYVAATGMILARRDPATGKWHAASDRVVLWADTALHLAAGQRIICSGSIRPFSSRHENYRRLMTRRGYAGTLSLNQRQVLQAETVPTGSLHRWAVERLNRLRLAPEEKALCNAMAAGERSGLTAAMRNAYSRSGTSHLLAVSGLHVGIVFSLVNLLLWGLPALWSRRGHLVRNLVAVALIWLYAAVADFPPSVVRAALMFSALQFALSTASAGTGLNTLAATAFAMLLFRPSYLGDISFQLSFLAVGAILAWSVPLCRRFRTGRRWIDWPVTALVVGGVSALVTAPLVSHTFGIVSLVGLAVNPAAIVLAHVVVFASVVWIVLPATSLAPVFEAAIGTAAGLLNRLADAAASLPGGSFDFRLTAGQTAACYAVFLATTLLAACRNPKKAVSLPR